MEKIIGTRQSGKTTKLAVEVYEKNGGIILIRRNKLLFNYIIDLLKKLYGPEMDQIYVQQIKEETPFPDINNIVIKEGLFFDRKNSIAVCYYEYLERYMKEDVIFRSLPFEKGIYIDDVDEFIKYSFYKYFRPIFGCQINLKGISLDISDNFQNLTKERDDLMSTSEGKESWLTDGNCEECRRKKYCNNPCTKHKRSNESYLEDLVASYFKYPRAVPTMGGGSLDMD